MKAKFKNLLQFGLLYGLLLFLALALPQAIALEDAEDRSLAAMCKRGLSESAILYAESQRQIASEPSLQAKWTMRIMECHALAALHSAPQSEQGREAVALHWEMPARIYKDFADPQPSNPRLPWLAWQAARCDLLHAQYTLARYLAVPSDTEIRETTLALVRSVMSQTESLLDDIRRRQPLAARGGRDGGAEAPVEQLAKLAVDTSLLQCEALLVRARLYEQGSPDRIAAATEVETRAAEVVTRAAEDWSALEKLTIARAVAQFELGGSETALLVLEGLARKSTDTQTRMRAAVLAIERLASDGESSRAQPLLRYLEQLGESPELAIARMQVSLSELATIPEESRQRALRELVGSAKSIGREFGDYWRNRADALLVGSVSSGSAGGASVSLDLMLVEVRQLLAADNLDGAVQKLIQFRDNESTAGRGESAIQLASQAAALLNREQRWAEAIAAVEPTILKFDQARNAAEAHMLVVWARTQMLRGNTESADLKTAYEDSLLKQLAAWPDSEVTDEAEQWLADWFIAGGRRDEFIDALQGRIRASTDLGIARAAVMRWLEQVLALNDASEVPALLQAIRNESQAFAQPEVQFSAKLAAHVAESFLTWPSASRQKQIQAERAKLRTQIKDLAVGQLIVAADLLDAFRQQKVNQAESLSGKWQPSQLPTELLAVLSLAFVEAIDELPINHQGACLQYLKMDSAWIEQLQRSSSPLHRALGYRFIAWLENASRGLEGIAELTKKHPRDGILQLQLSHALAASGENRIQESSTIARQLAANTPPESELYLASRWRLVRNAASAGQAETAKRIAGLTLATLPDEASVWKERFASVADSQ